MPHPAFASVRARFGGSCGYCGVSEADSAGDLTLDHYLPTSAGGADVEENLVYACFRCNVAKSDTPPFRADGTQNILHPLRDDVAVHVSNDASRGLVMALTETGQRYIDSLQLNRLALILHRLQKSRAVLDARNREILETENAHLRQMIQRLTDLLASLEPQGEG